MDLHENQRLYCIESHVHCQAKFILAGQHYKKIIGGDIDNPLESIWKLTSISPWNLIAMSLAYCSQFNGWLLIDYWLVLNGLLPSI